jgi:hypothetical protein
MNVIGVDAVHYQRKRQATDFEIANAEHDDLYGTKTGVLLDVPD